MHDPTLLSGLHPDDDVIGFESTLDLAGPCAGEDEALIGRRLGKYELKGLLGRGGMGAVFRAKHVELGQAVAIKVLDKSVVGDAGSMARLYREAASTTARPHAMRAPTASQRELLFGN